LSVCPFTQSMVLGSLSAINFLADSLSLNLSSRWVNFRHLLIFELRKPLIQAVCKGV
jgi:hypothetical protein